MRSPFRCTLLAVGASAALVLPGCGASGAETAGALDRAFDKTVDSAQVSLDLEARVRGVAELEDPMRLRASGPYVNNGPNELPSFDWKIDADGRGMGFSARAISSGENAWLEVLGTPYEIGEDQVAELERSQGERSGGGDVLESLGVDPADWFVDPSDEGVEDVAGVPTTHVSARLDVERFLTDMDRVAERMRPAADRLTPAQRQALVEAVKEPEVDVWVGEDDIVRRLEADLEFDVPEDQRAQAEGLESGTVSFKLELADVGGRQVISEPKNARPLEELFGARGSGEAHSLPGFYFGA